MQKRHLLPHTRTYAAHSLTNKVFRNMKRVSRGYSGVEFPLFPTMLTAPETSPSRITSSPSLSPEPSLSPQHIPISAPSTSQPPNTQPTPNAEEAVPTSHESPLYSRSLSLNELTVLCTTLSKKVEYFQNDLKQTKLTYGAAFTKLILRVKKLEHKVKTSKSRRKSRLILSDDEEDSSKQERKIFEIDIDPIISLVQLEQKDVDIHISTSDDTEVLLEEDQPTELKENKGSGEKCEKEVTTPANFQTYARRSREVSTGSGGVSTASRQVILLILVLPIRQERASLEAAIRLEEQLNEEETQRIARDVEIARQLQEGINIVGQERVVVEDDQAHVIDWSDPSMIRYHALKIRPRSVSEVRKNMCIYLKNQEGYKLKDFKGMTYDDIRPIFEKVWDQIHSFVPMDSELEVQRLKRKGQEVQEEPAETQKTETKQVERESSKKAGGKRKKSLGSKRERETLSEESANKQKLEDDAEKEELQVYLNIVSEDEGLDVESLSTKADGSSKNYKIFSEMLYDFDRQNVLELDRLVKERFQTASPEGYDLLSWGDLKIMIEPNEADEIWRNQQDWNLVSWKLHNFCGVHVILMDTGLVIHMMVEKKYPLSQDTLLKCYTLMIRS
ncbi:hypothetical protein Tco_0586472 [Tanacetum coccineum]